METIDKTHALAFGHSIKTKNLGKLNDYLNNTLKDVNFNEGYYEVDFSLPSYSTKLSELIYDIENNRPLFGQGNKEPLIVVEDIALQKDKIGIIGQNKDTVKFECQGVTYIKFKAKELIDKLNSFAAKSLTITVIGKASVNEWQGRKTPQILIDDIEIKEGSIYDF